MSELNRLKIDDIRALVEETERTLNDLKEELKRRAAAAQEDEIEHLDDHLASTRLSLKTIREFIAHLVDEFRSKE